jgi:hypothetical protein
MAHSSIITLIIVAVVVVAQIVVVRICEVGVGFGQIE